jgi:hypothetical protein
MVSSNEEAGGLHGGIVMLMRTSIALLCLIALPIAAQTQKLTGDEIRTLISGKSFDRAGGGVITYAADGNYTRSDLTGSSGKWTIKDASVCVAPAKGDKPQCHTVERRAAGYVLLDAEYTPTGITLRP